MHFNPLTMLLGMLVVIYMGWVVIAGTPADRMHRSCLPVLWTGTMVSSLVEMASESGGQRTEEAFEGGYDACRRMVWRLIYEGKDVEREREQYYD